MWSVLYVYPGGRVGAGLVLLRLGVAGSCLVLAGMIGVESGWRLVIALIVALAIAVGWRTRSAALLGGGVLPLLALAEAPLTNLSLNFIGSMALALIGPGAFSIDSRLYGRRRIVVPNDSDVPD